MNQNIFETVEGKFISNPQQNSSLETVINPKTSILYFDQFAGETYLKPEYAGYFARLDLLLQTLKNKQNENWTQEQKDSFLNFIDDCSLYIEEWIFMGLVETWEDFQDWLNDVKTTTNPVGFDLYEERLKCYQEEMNKLFTQKQINEVVATKYKAKYVEKTQKMEDEEEEKAKKENNKNPKGKYVKKWKSKKEEKTKVKYMEKVRTPKKKYVEKPLGQIQEIPKPEKEQYNPFSDDE